MTAGGISRCTVVYDSLQFSTAQYRAGEPERGGAKHRLRQPTALACVTDPDGNWMTLVSKPDA